MTAFDDTLERFRDTVFGPAAEVPLARAALLIAQAEQPAVDVDAYERRIQQVAEQLEQRSSRDQPALARLRTANELLFAELGFAGDEQQYDDIRNMLLNEVIDRRSGIPVTLAILHVEVCQRAGLDVQPIGLPGHVVTRLTLPEGAPAEAACYIDVFRGGRLLTEEECRRLVRLQYGRRLEFRAHLLCAVTPRQLLQRLLHNIKSRALQAGNEERAARMINLLLAMFPWELDELRDRGMLRERLGDYGAALADLEQYMRFRGGARDIQTVNEAVRSLRRHIAAERG